MQQLITLRESTVELSASSDSLIKSGIDLPPTVDLEFLSMTFQANVVYYG